ncbi:hypothetical protein SCHPADRAFT_897015 [Schizopora paradoxa]|uniref:Uncharacterized protein n=1 Tax=Schizopora paradoxa TaxID=27342 RepID=A0A0H2QY32_9AGAM|nr:hypothetical protein SCHPADRAFT_897015 [Schizopora paradoxa]
MTIHYKVVLSRAIPREGELRRDGAAVEDVDNAGICELERLGQESRNLLGNGRYVGEVTRLAAEKNVSMGRYVVVDIAIALRLESARKSRRRSATYLRRSIDRIRERMHRISRKKAFEGGVTAYALERFMLEKNTYRFAAKATLKVVKKKTYKRRLVNPNVDPVSNERKKNVPNVRDQYQNRERQILCQPNVGASANEHVRNRERVVVSADKVILTVTERRPCGRVIKKKLRIDRPSDSLAIIEEFMRH